MDSADFTDLDPDDVGGVLVTVARAAVALTLVLTTSGCAPLFCIACDGGLAIAGEVYEWLNAPVGASSVVFVDRELPQGLQVKPLGAAQVKIEPWLPRQRSTDLNANHPRVIKATSNNEGQVAGSRVVKPGHFSATISVTAPGFRTTEQVFYHDRLKHSVRVLMVRGGIANAETPP